MIIKIFLKRGKEVAVKRFHPWLFSGAIERLEGNPTEGDIVEIRSHQNEYLATGHYQLGSIAVKIFSFSPIDVTPEFWHMKLRNAYTLRQYLGLTESPLTNAYRLVHSEGDGLPGLIIDYYNGVAVIQSHSTGMVLLSKVFANALKSIYGEKLIAVYHKNQDKLRTKGKVQSADGFLVGHAGVAEIMETAHRFKVDFIHGQKTGFFLDKRSNRMFAQFYARGRRVLDAFSYSGAFAAYALKGGATEVHSVDSSKQALEMAKEHITINGIDISRHRPILSDVRQFLDRCTEQYEMIILDPPAFAKSHRVTNNALQAYIHINRSAMEKLAPGRILMTFSCSQAISREVFRSAVQSAAMEADREVKLLHHLTQGPDHPVSIFHPEGEYLKGLIVMVE